MASLNIILLVLVLPILLFRLYGFIKKFHYFMWNLDQLSDCSTLQENLILGQNLYAVPYIRFIRFPA
jgi:hypothetical protein